MDILRENRNHLALLTLDRPGALNALSIDMIRALSAALEECAADPAVRVVLLRGAGEKAFCAGGDLRALYQSMERGDGGHRGFFIAEYSLDYLLHTYPKPTVALMDGIAMGGGMGLGQASDLRIVGERTRIAMPEVAIGLFPDVGASHFLSRLPGALGTYLGLTGIQIDGVDALYAQLADVYLPPAASADLARRLAELEWGEAPAEDVRRAVHAMAAQGLPAPALSRLRAPIERHFRHATVLRMVESLQEETDPAYVDWARQTVKLLRSRSPIMLEVTLQQLQRGKTLDLADCFRLELDLVQHCVQHGDLREGIRALIIDKDHAPRWSPARLEEVTPAMVEAFFENPWPQRPAMRLEPVRVVR